MVRGVGQATVADRTGSFLYQVNDILGAMHVQGALTKLALLAEHRTLEVGVGAGIILATHHHDLLVLAARHLDTEIGPLGGFAATLVDFPQDLAPLLLE